MLECTTGLTMEFVVLTLFALFGPSLCNVLDSSVHSEVRSVADLEYYVSDERGRAELDREFESIQGGQRRSCSEGEKPINVYRNRYPELPAFDHNRVKLPWRSYDSDSDYINANYIEGYHRPREYIATQGPIANTSNDFWAMVWNENATKIVVLANLYEHGKPKVAKYWPEAICTFGDITVGKLAEIPLPEINHVIRIFSLRKTGESELRIVRQFHYTGWPDLGVPEDPMSVVGLMDVVRKYRPDSTTPIIVHCSAGVGRTGTVIMTDSMLEKAKNERLVDFPKRLDTLRTQRLDAVEKKEQYVFGHRSVNELFNNPESQNYLRNVESLHRSADWVQSTVQYKEPIEVAQAVQQMKWHSQVLQILIGAIETGLQKAPGA